MVKRVVRAVVLLVVILATPSVALAHAGLESSDPSPGAYLEASPSYVTLTFDEPVSSAFGSIRVVDASAEVRLEIPLRRGDTKDVVIGDLDEQLEDGTYVVVWRVMSSDGHPVQGSFTFSVGDATSVMRSEIATTVTASHGLSRLFVVIRLSIFLSLAVLVGTIVLLWANEPRRLAPRMSIVVRGAWLVLFTSTIEAFFAFGPHAAGVKIYHAFDVDLIRATLTTTFGRAQVVRLVVLGALWPVISGFIGGKRRLLPTALGLGGVVATVSVSGHAISTSPMVIGVAVDVIHLFAIGSWIGGLFVLVFISRRATDEHTLSITNRFSHIAQIALPVVIVSGVTQSWLLVKDPTEIFDTQFGRTLVIKVALVSVIIALSGTARLALKRRDAGTLRTTVAFEVVVALVVMGLTASLTGLSPRAVSSAEPFQQTIVGSEVFVTLAVTPARVGSTEVHLIMARQGGALGELLDVQMRMSLASMSIPSGAIELTRIAPNHYTAEIMFPFAGQWDVEVLASTEPFAVSRYVFEVPISK